MDLFSQPEPAPAKYFNTVSESGSKLKEYTAKTANQNARVLDILRSLGSASPSQVWAAMDRSCPITSVRRAMNTLTDMGKLEKTNQKMISPWKRGEHFWKIVAE